MSKDSQMDEVAKKIKALLLDVDNIRRVKHKTNVDNVHLLNELDAT